jgi:hypothetical protein
MTPTFSPLAQYGAASSVPKSIQSAATRTGVDFDYLLDVARVESDLRPDAKARTSSATGLFQFTRETWLSTVERHGTQHGLGWAADAIQRDARGTHRIADPALREQILNLRNNPDIASLMAAELTSDNRKALSQGTSGAIESVDLYLAHFLGSAGATRFLQAWQADPDQSAAALFPEAARSNRPVFYAADGSMRSLDDVRNHFATKLNATNPSVHFADASPDAMSTTQWLQQRSPTAERPLELRSIEAMPRGLSVDFAAAAYRRLSHMGGRPA